MTSSLIPSMEATGRINLTMAQVGDLLDIDRRIKDGDESGWRGDPSMGIFVNTSTGWFEVWGYDRAGREYLAASHETLDHTLLIKLREGDMTRPGNDPFQKVLDHNAKLKADQDRREHDEFEQLADKMQWGIRQDFAQHLGGRRTQWSIQKGESSPIPVKEPVDANQE